MSFARSLAPTTQETYRRDLDRYVLPTLGARRLGQLTAIQVRMGHSSSTITLDRYGHLYPLLPLCG